MQLSRRQTLASLGSLASLSALAALPGARPPARSRARSPWTERFLDAVRAGELDAVDAMLADDAGLAAAADERGRSALVLAFMHGHEPVARRIAEVLGSDALDVVEAVLVEDWDRFAELCEADPSRCNAAHPIGGTPLYAGALSGSLGFWRMRSAGCESDAAPRGGTGFTPVRGALEAPHAHWAAIAVADLCGNGADVNARQKGGSSALHGAVLRRDATLVRLCVRKGADPAAKDDDGRTPRALAAELGWSEGERLLADPTALPRDNRGSRFALDANREPIVRPDLSDVPRELQSRVTGSSHVRFDRLRELVKPDPRLVFSISSDDELAIEASAHIGSRDIMRFHLDHGAPLSLPTAVSLGDVASVKAWLADDPTLIHERGAHDFALMWYAAIGGGSIETAELLANAGASVDQESVGTTALHWCARRGRYDLARWLLDRGANPEAVGYRWDRAGETPLAVAGDDAKMVGLLREAGARR